MLIKRIIPCLTLRNSGLVKTKNFRNAKYVGDPINAVKIFNDKGVDELIFIDIDATVLSKTIPFDLINDLAKECFMPFCYGGGISDIEEIRKILKLGVEKVVINSAAFTNPTFIKEACETFGGSTIVVSIDVKKNFWGKYNVYIHGGRLNTKKEPVAFAKEMELLGVGEIMVNSIDRDGTMEGYDIRLVQSIASVLNIPVIACGGAGSIADFQKVLSEGEASAVAAGSFFIYQGKHNAVLLSYPSADELKQVLNHI